LRLKGLYNQNSFQYNYALKVTAAYTTDRSVLFDFITSDSFTAIQRGLYQQKLAELEAISVSDSEHVTAEKTERPTDSEIAKQSILTSIREAENREPAETLEALQNTPEIAEENINPEDFGPVTDEPQFLPEAIAPVEFTHIETPEFVPVEDQETDETVAESKSAPELAETAATVETIERVHQSEVETSTETSEAKLEIGKPLTFAKDETHSFAEWLQLTKLQPIVRDEKPDEVIAAEETPSEKVSKDELIDRFIETNPKMPKVSPDVTPVELPQKDDTSSLMTETLARVYLEQRKYQKAIQAYEILILKYPEKSSFFADRISEIKNLQQNNIL